MDQCHFWAAVSLPCLTCFFLRSASIAVSQISLKDKQFGPVWLFHRPKFRAYCFPKELSAARPSSVCSVHRSFLFTSLLPCHPHHLVCQSDLMGPVFAQVCHECVTLRLQKRGHTVTAELRLSMLLWLGKSSMPITLAYNTLSFYKHHLTRISVCGTNRNLLSPSS